MIQPSMQHNYPMNPQSKKHIHPFPTFLGNLSRVGPYSKLLPSKHGNHLSLGWKTICNYVNSSRTFLLQRFPLKPCHIKYIMD